MVGKGICSGPQTRCRVGCPNISFFEGKIRVLKIIIDFDANLTIIVDFGATSIRRKDGARIRARTSKKSIKDDKDTKTLMENTVAGTRTNTKTIQNLSVPQNVDFGFSDFPQNPDHFFFENHQKAVRQKSSISYQNPDESGRSLD